MFSFIRRGTGVEGGGRSKYLIKTENVEKKFLPFSSYFKFLLNIWNIEDDPISPL